MEQYKLSSHLDPDKAFIVNRSKLGGRFDPQYSEPNRMSFYDKLKVSPRIVRLKEVIKEGSYGVLPPGDSYDDKNPIKFIRATELKEDLKVDFENVYYVEEQYYSRRAAIKQGDILLAVKGATIASNKCVAYVLNDIDRSIVNGSIFRFQTKRNALPQYVAYVLESPLLKKQMKYNLVANNAVDYLDKHLINNLLIPLPSLEVQQQIVDLYQEAYNKKRQNEADAKALLDSIDSYLLGELGITLPEKNNSLEKRVFTTQFSEITGGRLNPKGYDSDTIALKNAITNIPADGYIIKPLKEFTTLSVAGDWGVEDCDDYDSNLYERCLVIRATEYDNEYNLKLDNSRVKFRLIKKDKLKRIDIQEDDLLIEKSGGSPDQPVGRIAILTKDILTNQNICYSNFLHKIRVNSDIINPSYLFSYLKTLHNIKLTESMQSQTNGIRNLIMSTYLNQFIVLPTKKGKIDIDKQNEIAQHIQSIREQAKKLQDDAKTILEKAKKEVEEMILG